MNKKELTEAFKIIYDSQNEEKDSSEEIKKLKNELAKRDYLVKALIRVIIPYVKTSQFQINCEVTPYDLVKYIEDYMNLIYSHKIHSTDCQEIDDEFIDEVIGFLNNKWEKNEWKSL